MDCQQCWLNRCYVVTTIFVSSRFYYGLHVVTYGVGTVDDMQNDIVCYPSHRQIVSHAVTDDFANVLKSSSMRADVPANVAFFEIVKPTNIASLTGALLVGLAP